MTTINCHQYIKIASSQGSAIRYAVQNHYNAFDINIQISIIDEVQYHYEQNTILTKPA